MPPAQVLLVGLRNPIVRGILRPMTPLDPPLPKLPAQPPLRRGQAMAWFADLLCGVAVVVWWAAVAPWRAAVVGVPRVPAEEAIAALALAAVAVATPLRRDGRAAAAVAFAGALAVAVAAGWLESADPVAATSFVYGAAVLGLPIAGCLAAFVSRTTDEAGQVAAAWFRCAFGAVLGAFGGEVYGSMHVPWSLATGVAATVASIACGSALFRAAHPGARSTVEGAVPDELAGVLRCGALLGAIAAWAIAAPFGIGSSPSGWPIAVHPLFAWASVAFGCVLGGRWHPAASAAPRALVCAACAVAAASATTGSETAAAIALGLVAILSAPGLVGSCRSRSALGFVLGGATFVLMAMAGASPAVSFGILAALAGLGVAQRGAAGWFAAAVGVAVVLSAFADGETVPADDPADRALAAHGVARVVWRPQTQETILSVQGLESDRGGPSHRHAELATAAVCLLAEDGPIAVVDDGLGAFAEIARTCGAAEIWRSSPVDDVPRLGAALRADGPARERAPGQHVEENEIAAAGARALALHTEPGSCVALVDAALLGPASRHRSTVEERWAMARAAGDGIVVFCFSPELTSPALVESAVGAAAAVHGWCGVFLAGQSAVVVGATRAPDWQRAAARHRSLPSEARWLLHAAGIGSAEDLRDALLTVVAAPREFVRDDASLLAVGDGSPTGPCLAANLRLLRSWQGASPDPVAAARLDARGGDPDAWSRADATLADAVASAPNSVLLRGELIRLRVRRADHAILGAARDAPARVAEAAALAARFVPFGCPSAPLQAALALPDRKGEKLRERRSAAAAAFALDPGFFDRASPLLRGMLEGVERTTPAADFARFPTGLRLAELSAQEGPLAVLLRVRHPSRAAHALVEQWRHRTLSSSALAALREIADPFVLVAAAEALAARGGQCEIVRVWRADLPATAPILALLDGPAEHRSALMAAVAGRKDPGSLHAIGSGLVDDDDGVRTAAGAALFRSIGDAIDYDPTWPSERLRDAAARLAQLSKRTSR